MNHSVTPGPSGYSSRSNKIMAMLNLNKELIEKMTCIKKDCISKRTQLNKENDPDYLPKEDLHASSDSSTLASNSPSSWISRHVTADQDSDSESINQAELPMMVVKTFLEKVLENTFSYFFTKAGEKRKRRRYSTSVAERKALRSEKKEEKVFHKETM